MNGKASEINVVDIAPRGCILTTVHGAVNSTGSPQAQKNCLPLPMIWIMPRSSLSWSLSEWFFFFFFPGSLYQNDCLYFYLYSVIMNVLPISQVPWYQVLFSSMSRSSIRVSTTNKMRKVTPAALVKECTSEDLLSHLLEELSVFNGRSAGFDGGVWGLGVPRSSIRKSGWSMSIPFHSTPARGVKNSSIYRARSREIGMKLQLENELRI